MKALSVSKRRSFSGAWLAFVAGTCSRAQGPEARYVATEQALAGLDVRDLMVRRPVTVEPGERLLRPRRLVSAFAYARTEDLGSGKCDHRKRRPVEGDQRVDPEHEPPEDEYPREKGIVHDGQAP